VGSSRTNAEAVPRQQLHDDIIEGLLASQKVRPETFERMAARAGWRVFDCWTGESPTFAIFGLSA
jgi:hypothetical protein